MVDFEKIKVQWSKVPVPYNRSPVRNIDAPYNHPTLYKLYKYRGAAYNTETRCGYNTETRCGDNTKFSKNFMREWLL